MSWSFCFNKFARFKSVAQGDPVVLIKDGQLDSEIMKKNNMDVDEVRMLLRMKEVFSLSKVKYAILEESGELSVMQYAGGEPPTRSELKTDYPENELSYLFVDSGIVEHERLKEIGKDETWLREKIKEETGSDLDDVFFAEWDEYSGFFVQKRQK